MADAPAAARDDHSLAALPRTALSETVDRIVVRISDEVSWVWVVLVAVITVNVVMRYVFGEGRIEFEELQWHLYAIGFLIGLSSCYATDEHVRIDVLSERFPLERKAWIEFYGIVLLMVPFMALVLIYAVPFIVYSFAIREVSEAPGGLPFRWAIKAILFVTMGLLALAVLARLTRVTALLFGVPRPLSTDTRE